MRKRWEPNSVNVRFKEIDAHEFKQRLEEVAEILYGRKRQPARNPNLSTESRTTDSKRPKSA